MLTYPDSVDIHTPFLVFLLVVVVVSRCALARMHCTDNHNCRCPLCYLQSSQHLSLSLSRSLTHSLPVVCLLSRHFNDDIGWRKIIYTSLVNVYLVIFVVVVVFSTFKSTLSSSIFCTVFSVVSCDKRHVQLRVMNDQSIYTFMVDLTEWWTI